MMVAGIGMKTGAPREDILKAIDMALERANAKRTQLDALATLDDKAAQIGLSAAAHDLNLPVIGLSRQCLTDVSDDAITQSRSSMVAQGVPSVAETAALAAIGDNAKLLGPRVKSATATCALATNNSEPRP